MAKNGTKAAGAAAVEGARKVRSAARELNPILLEVESLVSQARELADNLLNDPEGSAAVREALDDEDRYLLLSDCERRALLIGSVAVNLGEIPVAQVRHVAGVVEGMME